MDLRQLACFVTVAEELHFGRAAARLHMTQPPLSRQIQQLEQHMGVALFERSSRVVHLTVAGRSFLRDARHLLASAQHAVQAAQRSSSGADGHLRLGFTAVAAYRLMPAWVKRAASLLPGVSIDLQEMVSTELARALVAAELDVVLTRQVPRHQGLASQLVEREPMVLALPHDSPLAEDASVSLQALDGQRLVAYSSTASRYFHERVSGALSLAGVAPRVVQNASQTHTLVALVRAGIGVGIVPDSARELQFLSLIHI